jgi:hypothetical protein
MIEKLILEGGLSLLVLIKKLVNYLYSFTPKIKILMPDLYDEHLNEVNSCVMNLWEKGLWI